MKRSMIICFSLVIFLSGCSWIYELGGAPSEEEQMDMSKAELFVPEFSFTNQEGENFGTEQLQGNYYVSNMIFTHCTTVCPTMTPNMERMQSTLEEEGIDIQFVTFTVDPTRDTPEHLKQYGTNVGANLETWTFLTNYSQEEITTFARDAFKAIVREDAENEDFMHSTSFFLVNKEGQVIRKYNGLQIEQEPIITDIKKVVEANL